MANNELTSVTVDTAGNRAVDEKLIKMQVDDGWIPHSFIIRYNKYSDKYFYEFVFSKPKEGSKQNDSH